MNVVVCSAFRDSARTSLGRYMAQLDTLRDALADRGDTLTVVWGEGDSRDGTRDQLDSALAQGRFAGELIDVTHGGRWHGSVVNSDRFRQLAQVSNAIWEAIPDNADVVLFLESDLAWDTAGLLTLIDGTQQHAVTCGMVYHRIGGHRFYDTWAYSAGGKTFGALAPYHPALTGDEWVELDSAGSCLAIRGDMAHRLLWSANDVVRGICAQVRANGGEIWLNTTVRIVHP